MSAAAGAVGRGGRGSVSALLQQARSLWGVVLVQAMKHFGFDNGCGLVLVPCQKTANMIIIIEQSMSPYALALQL